MRWGCRRWLELNDTLNCGCPLSGVDPAPGVRERHRRDFMGRRPSGVWDVEDSGAAPGPRSRRASLGQWKMLQHGVAPWDHEPLWEEPAPERMRAPEQGFAGVWSVPDNQSLWACIYA